MVKYVKVKYKNSFKFKKDINGDYIRYDGKYVLINKVPPEIVTKKEITELLKGHSKIKSKVKKIKNLDKKLYYIKVWILTEENDLTKLKNHQHRGFRKYHLDHIFCISQGFKNNIEPEIIANIKNLQFIPYKLNLKKRDTVDKKALKILEEIKKTVKTN